MALLASADARVGKKDTRLEIASSTASRTGWLVGSIARGRNFLHNASPDQKGNFSALKSPSQWGSLKAGTEFHAGKRDGDHSGMESIGK